MNDPDTTPNTIEVLKSNLAEALPIAERLRQLPEVGRVLTLQSFVPEDQDAKLALIEDASFFFQNTLNPDQIDPEPTPAETRAAIENLVPELSDAARELRQPVRCAGTPSRKAARGIGESAAGRPGRSAARSDHAVGDDAAPSATSVLTAERVSIDTLPPALKQALGIRRRPRPDRGVAEGRCQRQRNLEPLRHGGSQCGTGCRRNSPFS